MLLVDLVVQEPHAVLMLRALALHARGHPAEALADLDRALGLGGPEGVIPAVRR